MNPDVNASARAEAIEWHIRLRDGDDADWEAFETWLGQDDAHPRAYREIEDMDLALDPLLPSIDFRIAANDCEDQPLAPAETRRAIGTQWWVMFGGAVAASIAALLLFTPLLQSDRYHIATGAGETRVVMLEGGSRITLNGLTEMTFSRTDPRFASLAEGEALFVIRHDDNRPFRLEVGDSLIEDAGTIFDVAHDGRGLRVAVAEGKVIYNPAREATTLVAGQQLQRDAAGAAVQVTSIPSNAVGSWQRGQLVLRGETLSDAAADFGRATGTRIEVAPEIAQRPLYGTISLAGSREERFERFSVAYDVHFEASGDGWILKPGRNGAE